MMLYFDNTSIPAGGLAGCCSLPNTIKKSLITNECVINDKIYRIKLLDNQMPQGGAADGRLHRRRRRQHVSRTTIPLFWSKNRELLEMDIILLPHICLGSWQTSLGKKI